MYGGVSLSHHHVSFLKVISSHPTDDQPFELVDDSGTKRVEISAN